MRTGEQCRECGDPIGANLAFCGQCLTAADQFYQIRVTKQLAEQYWEVFRDLGTTPLDFVDSVEIFASPWPHEIVARVTQSYVVIWNGALRKWCDYYFLQGDEDLREVSRRGLSLSFAGYCCICGFFRIDPTAFKAEHGKRSAIRDWSPSRLVTYGEQPEAYFLSDVDGRLRLVSYNSFDGFTFEQREGHGGRPLFVASAHIIDFRRSKELEAIEEFEELINDPSTIEGDIHTFLEQHPSFLIMLSGEYSRVHSHPHWTDRNGLLIPDFFLEKISGLVDVAELKPVSAHVVVGHGRKRRLSAEVTKAVMQLREYRDSIIENPNVRRTLQIRYPFRIARPNLILIIGRSTDFGSPSEKEKLVESSGGVRLYTHDDIVEIMRRRAMGQLGR